MLLRPRDREELARLLAGAQEAGAKGTAADVSALNRLVEHAPEDMVATAEAGLTLGALQSALRERGQWLPVDPPQPEGLSLGNLLAHNRSGPRRFGYGPIRDYLLGLRVAMANGEIIKAGGKVVKNVAGYDLCKLFTGARHTLGIIVEATFKLRPVPEAEELIQARCDSVEQLAARARAVLEAAVEPVILDAHNLGGPLTLVAGFAGAREDVEHQLAISRGLGLGEAGSLEHEEIFWRERAPAAKASVLPSEMGRLLARIDGAPFVARMGNGIAYYRGSDYRQAVETPPELATLMARVKSAYDPRGIFPEHEA